MTWLLPGCDKQQMKSAVGVGFSMGIQGGNGIPQGE